MGDTDYSECVLECPLLVGERIASLQPCLKPGSTPIMTQPLTGHTKRRWRRFRTNIAIDSFSAALVNFVLMGGRYKDHKQKGEQKTHKKTLSLYMLSLFIATPFMSNHL